VEYKGCEIFLGVLIAKLVLLLPIPYSSNLYYTALLDTPWKLPTVKAVYFHSYKNSLVVKTGVEITEYDSPTVIVLKFEAGYFGEFGTISFFFFFFFTSERRDNEWT
jgi:hypothetical protein